MSKPQSSGASSSKSKEIKIITKQVYTLDDIKNDLGKIKLLYIFSLTGSISEKALSYLIYEMKEKGYDLKYDFTMIGSIPSSKKLLNDLLALKYTGLIETTATKKLAISSLGREFLEKVGNLISDEEKDLIKKLVEELRVKIKPIDVEVEVRYRGKTRRLL